MAHHRHLPIWKAALSLAVHLEQAARRFARYHKYTLGQDLRHGTQRLCVRVARANDASGAARAQALDALVLAVEEIKTQWTLAQELGAFASFNEPFAPSGASTLTPASRCACRCRSGASREAPAFIQIQPGRLTVSLISSKLLLATVLACATPAWAAGTVTDATTGLVWDQCTYGLTGALCNGGSAAPVDWPTALTRAKEANAANYKGFNDWRLPNVNELESIVKIDTSIPAIDAAAFPATFSSGFWSSTSYAPSPAYAWIVYFYDGGTSVGGGAGSLYVRLVRSGQSLAAFDLLGAPANVVPTATSLAITGTAQFGQVLTGAYVYADADGDVQDVSGAGSSYRFVRSTDSDVSTTGDNTDVASGTTGGVDKTYTALAADVGKYLFYCVTPKALTGLSPGVKVCSSATVAIVALPQAITGFAPTTPVVFGAVAATLTATGGASGNSIVFATGSASSICTVSGTQLTYVGIGVCNLTANQAAGNGYSTAPQVTASVTITAPVSAPICSLTAVPARVVPGRSSTLTARCSPAAVTYTWTGGDCPASTGPTCTDAPVVTTLYGVTGRNSFGSSNAATTTVTVKSVDLTPILMLLLD